MTCEPKQERAPAIAVYVVSCDKYSDVWPFTFEGMRRHWPDLSWPIYLQTNFAEPDEPGVKVVRVGVDSSWSEGLRLGLSAITETYVLLWIDDLVLTGPVRSQKVSEHVRSAVEADANYLKLHSESVDAEDVLDEYSRHALYRTSTVFSIWKRTTLMELLEDGESAWMFEIAGSRRSQSYRGWLRARRTCFQYTNLVIKGKWNRDGMALLAACGFGAANSVVNGARGYIAESTRGTAFIRTARSMLEALSPRIAKWAQTAYWRMRRIR